MDSVLQLNSSFEPLGVCSLKQAVKLLYKGKAEIVADRGRELHAEIVAIRMPSVIRMLYFITRKRNHVPLTKKNVLLRDSYRCGYCSVQGGSEMTVDHVVPKSHGGQSTWTNLVASCSPCNARKRDRTPDEARMPLARKPHVPAYVPWVIVKKHTADNEWAKYLGLYGISIGVEERVG